VRDNHDVPGTPQFGATVTPASDSVIHVTTEAGPFAVTRPNTDIAWGRGETHVVTWDVAGTDAPPVSCANVAIDLSDDGGFTYDYALAASVPNTGTTAIVVPAAPDTATARVRVTCADSIFFDVSDVNFHIAATGDPDPTGAIAGISASSDVDSTAASVHPHQLTPGFAWKGSGFKSDGRPAGLWRVYVFSDKQCVNPVMVGSVTVTGNPWDSCRTKSGITDPREYMTFPYRVTETVVGDSGWFRAKA
jgi:hypothetical protein